ncbi:L,D-transpeptidase [Phyllobacterium salinisoli]|uniref:L,D-transpeptidase n=1 Tax=Phyllobacterium salinisoli TaxID=1899321 RepID=A0A368K1E7_9HYPH|nr:L,D-transpeptidase [Phyllobacterium salinisoli]RCS22495.1 L,D-transpeptidase [Phyllobacterium salinisoli]
MPRIHSFFRLALLASATGTLFPVSGFCAIAEAGQIDRKGGSGDDAENIQLAQLYDPGEEVYRDGRIRIYIDPAGRRITMDRRGRILSIEEPERQQRRVRRVPAPEDNWTLDGPVDGGVPYDGFGDVPEDPYARAPDAPRDPYYDDPAGSYDGNRDGQVERLDLPPPDASASLDDDSRRPAIEPSPAVPDPGDMAPAIEMPKGQGAKSRIAAYQVLLDRAGASPGVIDGRAGSNVDKATAAYGELTGKYIDPSDEAAVNAELEATGGPAFVDYIITDEDAAQPYIASVPEDYSEKAQLPSMAFTSVREMLGERFHIDEAYLQELNPDTDFRRPGTVIRVPNIGKPVTAKVARIVADKPRKQVRGYDEAGKLVVAYPSTIGSSDNPSPSGIVQVERIAINPNYTYNPKINFKQGNNDKVLTIPPGPNGPVGTVWIALSKPTYGIHGTPEPSKIGKTSSHGCVRLANWDAQELAKLVKPGVTVEFIE